MGTAKPVSPSTADAWLGARLCCTRENLGPRSPRAAWPGGTPRRPRSSPGPTASSARVQGDRGRPAPAGHVQCLRELSARLAFSSFSPLPEPVPLPRATRCPVSIENQITHGLPHISALLSERRWLCRDLEETHTVSGEPTAEPAEDTNNSTAKTLPTRGPV